jgi:hypothetical protein
MKIDPIFPVAPEVNPPLYKFRRRTQQHVDPEEDLKDPIAIKAPEECMSQEEKLFLLIFILLFVVMSFA